ncbi:NAD(P)-binding protein [Xylariaceae sp. FL0255]|nr:NAD(P)-binding protein [Xylariaceae sp. FL0255]
MANSLPRGTIVVTGAAGGLGCCIAAEISSSPQLGANHYGLYAVRNPSRTTSLINSLNQTRSYSSHVYDIVSLDLESLDSVRALATDINNRVAKGDIPRIRALVLNAGYLELGTQSWLENGLDATWAVNYLSQWLLTLLLLQSIDREKGRTYLSNPYDDFNKGSQGGQYDDEKWKTMLSGGIEQIATGNWSPCGEGNPVHAGLRRYGAAKLCLAMMIGELQERLDRDPLLNRVAILGCDPGWMAASISRRHQMYPFMRIVMPWVAGFLSWLQPHGMYRTPARSAKDVMAVAIDMSQTDGGNLKGVYFKGAVRAEVSAEAQDFGKRKMGWKGSVGYAGLQHGETLLQHWT